MIDFSKGKSTRLRVGETNTLPLSNGGDHLYFVVVARGEANMFLSSKPGLRNLWGALSLLTKKEQTQVVVLANWKGMYRADTFVCDIGILIGMLKKQLV
jgi:hypothetical protein